MDINDSVEKLPFVGQTFAKRLAKLNIRTIQDLINYFPFRYDNYSLISKVIRVQAGETVTIKAKVESIKNEYTKLGKKIQKATVSDNTGSIEIVWFNQPFLIKTIKVGEWYNFSGKADWFGKKIVLVSPEYEPLKLSTIHTGRLVPVYPETQNITSKWLRSRIKTALDIVGNQIEEFLPPVIVQKENLLEEKQAIFQIHFPNDLPAAQRARQRLAFDELLLIQLTGLLRKKEWQKRQLANKFFVDQEKVLEFVGKLPFELTGAQKKAIKEILADLAKEKPMNRLLQGDVGSGKTVVAAIAMYISFLNGFQSVIMAPTEILANQHFQTLKTILFPFGINIELITGSQKLTSNPRYLTPDIIVGTHALLYQNFGQKVGLVVIDEQHRFGVEQRSELIKKFILPNKKIPHLLTMTATPIPRTIALTLYGDLDFSILDEMPFGRTKVKTWVVPPQKRSSAYEWIKKRVKGTQEQAFIVCPLIEQSETLASLKAATIEFEKLKNIFPDLRLGLLHGKMKSKEKDKIIEEFRKGNLDILVSTPVVEVGIDIPNATIMMIEGADRFGLAQLHQLRGRVGRSNLESFCLLFTENQNPEVIKRLKYLEDIYVGLRLAEIDLKIRGPGEIYGTKQHGFPDLRVASFLDTALIEKTRKVAEEILNFYTEFLNSKDSPLHKKMEKYKILQVSPN